MVIFQYVTHERSYDKFHPDHEDLYRVQYNFFKEGETIFECAAAKQAVGPEMKKSFPEVLEYARAFPMLGLIRKRRYQLQTKASGS